MQGVEHAFVKVNPCMRGINTYPTTFIALIALHCNNHYYERNHMWRNFKEILAFVSIT